MRRCSLHPTAWRVKPGLARRQREERDQPSGRRTWTASFEHDEAPPSDRMGRRDEIASRRASVWLRAALERRGRKKQPGGVERKWAGLGSGLDPGLEGCRDATAAQPQPRQPRRGCDAGCRRKRVESAEYMHVRRMCETHTRQGAEHMRWVSRLRVRENATPWKEVW